MATKKYRIKDNFGGGYTEYDKTTGEKEHFIKHGGVFSEGYYGNKGSVRSKDKITKTRTLKDKDGEAEVFRKGYLDDDYYGSKGTHVSKHLYGDGFSISEKGGKRKEVFKNKGPLTTSYVSTAGDSYDLFNDDLERPAKADTKTKYDLAIDRTNQNYGGPMGPSISIAIDLIILLYAFLALLFGSIPKHDIITHVLLVLGLMQYSYVCGANSIDAVAYVVYTGILLVPHFLLHLFGIVGARDKAFYTYDAIGPAFIIIAVAFALSIIMYILGRNGFIGWLFSQAKKRPRK